MKFYCHYNLSIGEISKVSPQKEKDNKNDDNILVFEIQEEIALSMLSGKTSPQEWTAVKPQDNTSPEPFELTRRLNNAFNKINRVDGSFLTSFNYSNINFENNENPVDVHVIINESEKFFDMYFNIKSVLFSSHTAFDIFITPKNDYSYLKSSFKADLIELREWVSNNEEFQKHNQYARLRFNLNIDLTNISIMTTKLFNNLTMEIVK